MGRKKLLSVLALLSVLLGVPIALSLGVVDVSQFSLFSAPAPAQAESSSSTPTVFVDPAAISDDALQSGSYFTVHVNISDITDLFSWQINMSWDSSILNASSIIAGEFLLQTASENKTAAYQLGYVINVTDNAEGHTAMGESILGDVLGINDNGTLVSIEFLVTGYGSTDLTISLTGNLATTLLNSTGETITLPPENVLHGYFRNKYVGDMDADWDVDYPDFLAFLASYLKTSGQPGYSREADFDLDGDVDYPDFLAFLTNYLKTFP